MNKTKPSEFISLSIANINHMLSVYLKSRILDLRQQLLSRIRARAKPQPESEQKNDSQLVFLE